MFFPRIMKSLFVCTTFFIWSSCRERFNDKLRSYSKYILSWVWVYSERIRNEWHLVCLMCFDWSSLFMRYSFVKYASQLESNRSRIYEIGRFFDSDGCLCNVNRAQRSYTSRYAGSKTNVNHSPILDTGKKLSRIRNHGIIQQTV